MSTKHDVASQPPPIPGLKLRNTEPLRTPTDQPADGPVKNRIRNFSTIAVREKGRDRVIRIREEHFDADVHERVND